MPLYPYTSLLLYLTPTFSPPLLSPITILLIAGMLDLLLTTFFFFFSGNKLYVTLPNI